MKKIALIGSNSFLARKLQKKLKTTHAEITLWNRNPRDEELLFDYPAYPLDPNKLASYDVVIYLAGAGVQSGQQPSMEMLYGVNTITPIQLINQLSDLQFAGGLVFFGSYFEIGKATTAKKVVEEEVIYASASAFNEYCKSKRVLTHFIQQQIEGGLPFSLTHFLLPNMYGKGENDQRLIPYLVNNLKTGAEIKLSNGAQTRQFLHVQDIVTFLCQWLSGDKLATGIFNLGSNEIWRVADVVKKVVAQASALGFSVPPLAFGQAQRQDAQADYMALDDTVARENLRWCPKITMEQGIAEYFQ